MSGQSPERSGVASRWSATVTNAWNIVAGVSGIATIVLALVHGIEQYATKPLAGYTFHHVSPATGQATGQTIFKFEVFNPGPANLGQLRLEITVPDKYDHQKKQFGSGLQVSRSPSLDIEYLDNGGQDVVSLTPVLSKNSPAPLHADQRFWAVFVVPNADWKPKSAWVVQEGQELTDASKELIGQPASWWASFFVRWGPVALFGLLTIAGVVIARITPRRISAAIQEGIDSKLPDLLEQEVVKYQKALQVASLPTDAAKESDQFEEVIPKPNDPHILLEDRSNPPSTVRVRAKPNQT